MEWLLLLVLVPLSRVLFYIVLWIFHTRKSMENSSGIEVAKKILAISRLNSSVNVLLGDKEDCFDPMTNTIYLTEKNNRKTISSIAIAIHEVGHALQLNTKWALYRFRCRIIVMKCPLIYITAFLVVLSFWNSALGVAAIISLICLITCTVVELIVEINASVRGCRCYRQFFKTNKAEMIQMGIVLGAAAFTYFVDIFYCVYMVGRVLIETKNKENEANK